MQLQLESTSLITKLDGVECRVWRGRTAAGVRVVAFIHAVTAAEGQDHSELERELAELAAPREMPLGKACPIADAAQFVDDVRRYGGLT